MQAAGATAPPEILALADAFSVFVSASARLEGSYERLQGEVAYLSHELADRNCALKASLAENERVHRALQQIVDSMPCGVLVVESDGTVSMINPEGRKLLELGSAVAGDLEAISANSGLDLASFLRRSSGREEEQEFCCTSEAGKRWLAVHERSLSDGGKTGHGYGCGSGYGSGYESGRRQTILILRDTTPHKQAEQERERARKATALSEVATTLAHEIRNPLTSLELFAGLIASGGDDTGEWVAHLHAGIRSLAATVNNVLSFHGAGFAALAPLDLVATIRSSVEFARPIAAEAGVALEFGSDGSEVHVHGNSGALQQVVLNMVSNAIRHTKKGGRVRVEVRRLPGSADGEDADRAVIEFADTGSGIAPEHLPEIFRAGFSGGGTSSGLGLAVCRQIVKQHEGVIRVTSTPGFGTTFFVELPTV